MRVQRLLFKRLGEILKDEGLLTDEKIQAVLEIQRQTGQLFGDILVKLGYVTENEIAYAVSKQYALPCIDVSKYAIPRRVLDLVSPEMMQQNKFIPFDKIGDTLLVAYTGSLDSGVFERLEKESNYKIFLFITTPSQLLSALKKYFKLDNI
jgi:type IV pilus assembly protein PilB